MTASPIAKTLRQILTVRTGFPLSDVDLTEWYVSWLATAYGVPPCEETSVVAMCDPVRACFILHISLPGSFTQNCAISYQTLAEGTGSLDAIQDLLERIAAIWWRTLTT